MTTPRRSRRRRGLTREQQRRLVLALEHVVEATDALIAVVRRLQRKAGR